jgi:uncharacterized protein (DUF1684 family)
MPRTRHLAAVLLLALAAACGPGESASMVRVPPPTGWQGDLARQREARDDYFRRSPETPLPPGAVASFGGLEYWEPDPRYYFVGPIQPYPRPERFTIVTTTGAARPCERYGWIRFPIEGRPRTLQVYRLLDLGDQAGVEALLLAFRDSTTGRETYPAGRYVDLAGAPGGPYVLDFNTAYNPSCAYGDPQRFACPMAPPENWLDVAIEAGERGFVPPGELPDPVPRPS